MHKCKYLFLLVLSIVIFCFAVSWVLAEDLVPVDRITLSDTELLIIKGKTNDLVATVLPDNASNPGLEWISSDESVATVQKGKIKGNNIGECDITCNAADGSGALAVCHVKVVTEVKSIAINEKQVVLLFGSSDELAVSKLTYTVTPEDAYWQDVIWESSDEGVVTVGADGTVKGISSGKAIITAHSSQPESKAKASIQIVVQQAVTGIELDVDEISVPVKKSAVINAVVNPENAFNKKVEWISENEEIATVNNKGQIAGKGLGTTKILARSMDGTDVLAEVKVTVIQPVNNIVIPQNSIEIAPGVSARISASVEPEDAANKNLSYISSNEKVAVVNEYGMVFGLSKGTARITVAATDGSDKKATVNVKVQDYDMVFTSIKPQEIRFQYSASGNIRIRGKVKNDNVSIKKVEYDFWSDKEKREEVDRDFWMTGTSSERIEVTPICPGSDVVTISVNNQKLNYTVFVADYFESSDNQYVPVPDTKPDEQNGSFREIIYGTSYSGIIDTLIELYGNNYTKSDEAAGCNIEFKNPDINVAGHKVESICFWFCYDEDENGYIINNLENASFYKASYIIKETSCEKDYIDDYILGDNSITEDLYKKLVEVYGKQKTKFDQDDVSNGYSIHWDDNSTDIDLEYSNRDGNISLTYTWEPGYLKHSTLRDIAEYLQELEKQKINNTDKMEYDSSTEGL